MPRSHKKAPRPSRGPRYEDLPDLCTVEQARAYLQISRNASYDLISRGLIASVRFGKLIRIPKSTLGHVRRPA
jgi:excisionase family DNA binding protein